MHMHTVKLTMFGACEHPMASSKHAANSVTFGSGASDHKQRARCQLYDIRFQAASDDKQHARICTKPTFPRASNDEQLACRKPNYVRLPAASDDDSMHACARCQLNDGWFLGACRHARCQFQT